jgi:ribosome production factor 2
VWDSLLRVSVVAAATHTLETVQFEDAKSVLLLHGNKVSQIVKDALSDIGLLKRDQAMKYARKNDVHPFESGAEASLQFFCERSDCALFCLANHSKKRPHNLVIGRMFDAQLLDMVELGVLEFAPISDFRGAAQVSPNSKVLLPFCSRQLREAWVLM